MNLFYFCAGVLPGWLYFCITHLASSSALSIICCTRSSSDSEACCLKLCLIECL